MRALALLLLAPAALAQGLRNPSFDEGLDGWTRETGAHHGGAEPASRVDPADGALRLSGDDDTVAWRMAVQAVPCPPGRRVVLRVTAWSEGLRKAPRQYANANGLLLFRDAAGARLGLVTTPVLTGDRARVDLFACAFAPEGTATVAVGVFSSMTGVAWFDDVRLEITEPGDTAAALSSLRLHLERTYPFWDLPGRPKPEDLPLDPKKPLVAALVAMLAPLEDGHVWIDTPLGRVPATPAPPRKPNWHDKALRQRLEVVHEKDGHLVGRLGDVAFARIGNFREGFDALEKAMDGLDGARAWILDVRQNGGGDETLAWRIVRRFQREPIEHGFVRVRDPTLPGLSGFGPRTPRRLDPGEGVPDRRPVVVLQGPYGMSSTETFLLMMGRLGSVTTVGHGTRGSSGNPAPFPIAPGVEVWAPTCLYLRPDGEPVEGNGVAPDVRVEGSHQRDDPTLVAALDLLAR